MKCHTAPLRPCLHSTKPSSLLPAEPFPLNRRPPSPAQASVRSPPTSASQKCSLVCAQDRAQKIKSAQDTSSAIVHSPFPFRVSCPAVMVSCPACLPRLCGSLLFWTKMHTHQWHMLRHALPLRARPRFRTAHKSGAWQCQLPHSNPSGISEQKTLYKYPGLGHCCAAGFSTSQKRIYLSCCHQQMGLPLSHQAASRLRQRRRRRISGSAYQEPTPQQFSNC